MPLAEEEALLECFVRRLDEAGALTTGAAICLGVGAAAGIAAASAASSGVRQIAGAVGEAAGQFATQVKVAAAGLVQKLPTLAADTADSIAWGSCATFCSSSALRRLLMISFASS
jgi:hypothetical protein